MSSSPSATERPFRRPLIAVALACAASLALHAAAAGFAFYQFQTEDGAAPRAPAEVSIAQTVTEPLDSVAAEDKLAAAAGPSSAETLPEPLADELGSPPPEASQIVADNAPSADAARPPEDVTETLPIEAAGSAPALLADPPLESINARDAAPTAAAEAASRKSAEPRKAKQNANPSAEAKREAARKADAARRPAARKADKAKREAARNEKNAARAKPGAPSRQADKAQAGRASASAGAVASFAAQVRAAVARRRPGASGFSGTAIVSFGLRPGGGLAAARLSRSSGNARLDSLALGAVRGAAFPRPPAGASPAQLRFTIPFHFR